MRRSHAQGSRRWLQLNNRAANDSATTSQEEADALSLLRTEFGERPK